MLSFYLLPLVGFSIFLALSTVHCDQSDQEQQVDNDQPRPSKSQLLHKFLYEMASKKRRQQQLLADAEMAMVANPKATRPCYFSPIQCLLRTQGQHEMFENHPEINGKDEEEAMDGEGKRQAPRHGRRHLLAKSREQTPAEARIRKLAEALIAQQRAAEGRENAGGEEVPMKKYLVVGNGIGVGRPRLFGGPRKLLGL